MARRYHLYFEEPSGKLRGTNDISEWGKWFDKVDRQVARTEIPGNVLVSTIFMAVDHNFEGKGPPILYETMVFREGGGEEQRRYPTREEAETGHRETVEALQEGRPVRES